MKLFDLVVHYLTFRRYGPVLVMAFLLPLVTACGSIYWPALLEKLPPEIDVPFSLAESGYVLTTDFEAGEKTYTYTFYLDFSTDVTKQLAPGAAHAFGFDDPHTGAYQYVNGQYEFFRTGGPIPLRLTVSRINGKDEVIAYDKEFSQLIGFGGNRSSILRTIDKIKLEPGHYRVRLETLASVGDLAAIPVNFRIGLPGKH